MRQEFIRVDAEGAYVETEKLPRRIWSWRGSDRPSRTELRCEPCGWSSAMDGRFCAFCGQPAQRVKVAGPIEYTRARGYNLDAGHDWGARPGGLRVNNTGKATGFVWLVLEWDDG